MLPSHVALGFVQGGESTAAGGGGGAAGGGLAAVGVRGGGGGPSGGVKTTAWGAYCASDLARLTDASASAEN